MSDAAQGAFAKDSWQTPRNARTLRAYMALQNQEIGARLRELRRGRPQTAIAEALEVSERAYQNWEAGDAKPSYRNLQRLAEFYGVGEDYILTGSNPTETPDLMDGALAGDGTIREQLAEIQRQLAAATSERDAILSLLARQDAILERIEKATAKNDDSTQRLDAAAQESRRLLRELESAAQSLAATRPATGDSGSPPASS